MCGVFIEDVLILCCFIVKIMNTVFSSMASHVDLDNSILDFDSKRRSILQLRCGFIYGIAGFGDYWD